MLSTRRDLLGDEIADELEKLLDQVPPFAWDQARVIIEQQLGMPMEQAFPSFDQTNRLGVDRPGLRSHAAQRARRLWSRSCAPASSADSRDIEVLMLLAKMADRYWRRSRVKPIQAVVREFEKTIMNELDLVARPPTPANCDVISTASPDLYVPRFTGITAARR